MNRRLLELVCCPACRGDLAFSELSAADGMLRCGTGHWYPVMEGVPRFAHLPGDVDAFMRRYSIREAPSGRVELAGEQRTRRSFDYEWRMGRSALLKESVYRNTQEFLRATDRAAGTNDFRGKVFLDAGCGTGRYSAVARNFGAEVVAVDLSWEAVKIASSHPGVLVVQGNLLKLPFKPGVFDVVYSVGVLHHTADLIGAFRGLTELLKRDGEMILGVYKYYDYTPACRWLRRLTVKLPLPLLYGLSHLSIPLSFFPRIRYLCYPWLRDEDSWRKKITETFDFYSPYFQDYYRVETIQSWFHDLGCYRDVRVNRRFGTVIGRKAA